MKKTLALIMILFAVIVAMQVQAESVPFSQDVTVTAGAGSFTYAASIRKDYASSFKILAVLTPSTATTTNTIQVVDGTVTNTIATKVAAALDSGTIVTNDWYHFRDDKVLITSTDTNTFTAVIIGIED